MIAYWYSTHWLSYFFCTINGKTAIRQKVFCKQISEPCPGWPSEVIWNEVAILELKFPCPNASFLYMNYVRQIKTEIDSSTSQGCLLIETIMIYSVTSKNILSKVFLFGECIYYYLTNMYCVYWSKHCNWTPSFTNTEKSAQNRDGTGIPEGHLVTYRKIE